MLHDRGPYRFVVEPNPMIRSCILFALFPLLCSQFYVGFFYSFLKNVFVASAGHCVLQCELTLPLNFFFKDNLIYLLILTDCDDDLQGKVSMMK